MLECMICSFGKYLINYVSVSEDDCDVCLVGFYVVDGELCKECFVG